MELLTPAARFNTTPPRQALACLHDWGADMKVSKCYLSRHVYLLRSRSYIITCCILHSAHEAGFAVSITWNCLQDVNLVKTTDVHRSRFFDYTS